MLIQYAIIEGSGHCYIDWYWQFENDKYGVEVTSSYCEWFIPGTVDPFED